MCAQTLHGWSTLPNTMEDAFLKGDGIEEENCCLTLKELEYVIEGLGGLKQTVFPEQPNYELLDRDQMRDTIPITSADSLQNEIAGSSFSAAASLRTPFQASLNQQVGSRLSPSDPASLHAHIFER